MNQVFISFKMHDAMGGFTKDYEIAQELYEALRAAKISTFFSDVSLLKAGRADYKKKIDEELEHANVMVVVGTSPANVKSNWVSYEWDSFYNDILSENKKGTFISLIHDTESHMKDYPRTIRQNQSFVYAENGVQKAVSFIANYLNIEEEKTAKKSKKKGSSYGYDIGDEKNRLKIQAMEESRTDYDNLKVLVEKINEPVVQVLDFGCSMGETTRRVFSKFGDKVDVLGVDKFSKCVDEFNQESAPYHAIQANIDDVEFIDIVRAECNRKKIKGFHIVYCALSLHHTADTLEALKKLRSLLLPNGYIYIRTCDDGLKIGYPDPEKIINSIIEKTYQVAGASDRFHGRKIYNLLNSAKFVDVEFKPFVINTVGKDVVDRDALFQNTFSWRKNYFTKALNAATETQDEQKIETALAEYQWCREALERIDDMFADLNFYYEYYVTIVIAKKKSLA